MKKITLLISILFIGFQFYGQNGDTPTGWKFGGALPAISYDSDVGFRYGALGYIYDWGDGSRYPDYQKSIYLEWSRTTKGSGNNTFKYDDRAFLGSKIRLTSTLGYYLEQALDFYGFNGYQTNFNPNFSTTDATDYKSRMFYRHDRKMLRAIFDFQIPIIGNKLRAYTGVSFYNTKIASVDIDKLNEGKTSDLLPSVTDIPGVYESYVDWGLINANDANGGFITQFKGGLIFDTRNNEAMPTKGIWDELIFIGSPGFGGTSPYLQMNLTHSQYFTILPDKLSFAYRIAIQSKIAGDIPFYMLPFNYTSKDIRDGIGGSKTVRGMLRNRVVANSSAFMNNEIRWRVVNFGSSKHSFYVALSAFVDAAKILIPYEVDISNIPANQIHDFINVNANYYNIHLSYGGGIRFGYNENTIVAVDYGMANNAQDGSSGLYIGLGWLF